MLGHHNLVPVIAMTICVVLIVTCMYIGCVLFVFEVEFVSLIESFVSTAGVLFNYEVAPNLTETNQLPSSNPYYFKELWGQKFVVVKGPVEQCLRLVPRSWYMTHSAPSLVEFDLPQELREFDIKDYGPTFRATTENEWRNMVNAVYTCIEYNPGCVIVVYHSVQQEQMVHKVLDDFQRRHVSFFDYS